MISVALSERYTILATTQMSLPQRYGVFSAGRNDALVYDFFSLCLNLKSKRDPRCIKEITRNRLGAGSRKYYSDRARGSVKVLKFLRPFFFNPFGSLRQYRIVFSTYNLPWKGALRRSAIPKRFTRLARVRGLRWIDRVVSRKVWKGKKIKRKKTPVMNIYSIYTKQELQNFRMFFYVFAYLFFLFVFIQLGLLTCGSARDWWRCFYLIINMRLLRSRLGTHSSFGVIKGSQFFFP